MSQGDLLWRCPQGLQPARPFMVGIKPLWCVFCYCFFVSRWPKYGVHYTAQRPCWIIPTVYRPAIIWWYMGRFKCKVGVATHSNYTAT